MSGGAQARGREVRDRVAVPVIRGDGIGADIWPVTRDVLDAAVDAAYGSARSIEWLPSPAGREAVDHGDDALPMSTLHALRHHGVGLKGPLETPVGHGHRSLNVRLRQELDLYACIRPVRWFAGLPSPVHRPERIDITIFRENTEDVYAGLEHPAGSEQAHRLRGFVADAFGWRVAEDAGLGLKPISERASKRLVRAALRYAAAAGRPSVTVVHKGNIMKHTEGAFLGWAREVAAAEFPEVEVQDRIADAMFQDLILRPDAHSVLATTNLNGDYLSDALGALIGGIGLTPGANVNEEAGVGIFEAVHGTAPDIAGKDLANPTALLLSGAMLCDWIGWHEAAVGVQAAVERTIGDGVMTGDLARQLEGVGAVGTRAFGEAVAARLG